VNVVFTINLPQSVRAKPHIGEDDSILLPFQNIYAAVDAKSFNDLLKLLHENDYIVAREFNAKKKFDGSRLYEDRGEVIINCQMIGKIKPFFE
jgi:S-adenosylmethionine:tRNA-ribosyltransferase-isomerase (queuine synthetase)